MKRNSHLKRGTKMKLTPEQQRERREAIEKAGGWYLFLHQQREERERQEPRQTSEGYPDRKGGTTVDAPQKSQTEENPTDKANNA